MRNFCAPGGAVYLDPGLSEKSRIGVPASTVPFVCNVTAISRLSAPTKKISRPSQLHCGTYPPFVEICHLLGDREIVGRRFQISPTRSIGMRSTGRRKKNGHRIRQK